MYSCGLGTQRCGVVYSCDDVQLWSGNTELTDNAQLWSGNTELQDDTVVVRWDLKAVGQYSYKNTELRDQTVRRMYSSGNKGLTLVNTVSNLMLYAQSVGLYQGEGEDRKPLELRAYENKQKQPLTFWCTCCSRRKKLSEVGHCLHWHVW